MARNQIGRRLKELRIRKDMTQREVAEKSGIPFGTYSGYEVRDLTPDSIPFGNIVKLAALFGTTPDFIRFGDGAGSASAKSSDTRSPDTSAPYGREGVVYLPFIPVAARAGQGNAPNTHAGTNMEESVGVYRGALPRDHSDCVVIEIDGDSMEGTLHPGDRVLARLLDPSAWEQARGVVAVVTETAFLVKRVSLWTDGKLIMTSDNPAGERGIVVPVSDIVNLYAVIKLIDRKVL